MRHSGAFLLVGCSTKAMLRAAGFTLLLTAPLVATAQETGSASGVVRDSSGRPVPRAIVSVDAARTGIATDTYGRFLVRRIRAGSHYLQVHRIGYLPLMRDTFHVAAHQRTTLQVMLTRMPPREVWLGCAPGTPGVPEGTRCYGGGLVRAPCCIPNGNGIVRDESSWKKLWDLYGHGRPPHDGVRWDREMVYLLGLGAGDIDRFNRAGES